MTPSRLNRDQINKIAKTAIYIGISAVISYLISVLTDNPNLVGPLTPLVNLVLVSLKQVFTKPLK